MEIAKNSILVQQETSPPPTIQAIKNIAEQDLVNMQKVLAAYGYYDTQVDYFVDIRQNPIHVYLKVNLGPQYTLSAFKLKSDPIGNNQVSYLAHNIQLVGITLDMPAKRSTIQDSVQATINYLQNHGYPFAKLKEDRIVIDRATKTLMAALLISPGPMVRFGNTILEQNGEVTGEFIKKRLKWIKGEVYSEQKVIDTLQSLNNSRLFKIVRISHDDQVDQNGLMNMYIKLEGANKNVFNPIFQHIPGLDTEFGVSYRHLNAFQKGQILGVDAIAGHARKSVKMSLTTPDLPKLNMNTNASFKVSSEHYKPYFLKGGQLHAVVDTPLNDYTTVNGGVDVEIDRIEQFTFTKDYRLLSIPLGVTFKIAEEDLEDKKEARIKVEWTPYASLFSHTNFFDSLSIKPDVFWPLLDTNNLILHGWADIGLSPGAGRHVLPANKLFFGAPVRGYQFQYAGPLSDSEMPLGQRSMASFGLELEYYITPTWSILPFLDVGTTYNRAFPDFRGRLFWGVGAGVRYHSPYGIFYLDVASPINRRSGTDNAMEVYAGIKRPV